VLSLHDALPILSFLRNSPFAAMRIEEVGIIMHFGRTLRLPLDVGRPLRKRLFMALLALMFPEIEKADVDELLVDRHTTQGIAGLVTTRTVVLVRVLGQFEHQGRTTVPVLELIIFE